MEFSLDSDEGLNGFARLFMNTENRDFVIERLERQLKEKETELDDIKTNLRESILREIRNDLKNDLDFHNRIAQLERKIQTLSNNLNGVMDELLDQKSMIRALESASREKKADMDSLFSQDIKKPVPVIEQEPVMEAAYVKESVPVKEPVVPNVYRPAPPPAKPSESMPQAEPVAKTWVNSPSSVPKESVPSAKPVGPRFTVRSDELASARSTPPSSNINFNVREMPSIKKPEMPEPEHRSEYIIAETDDERKLRIESTSRRETESCSYIVAEEDIPSAKKSSGKSSHEEYETVEARESEDAVVVTTRRK